MDITSISVVNCNRRMTFARHASIHSVARCTGEKVKIFGRNETRDGLSFANRLRRRHACDDEIFRTGDPDMDVVLVAHSLNQFDFTFVAKCWLGGLADPYRIRSKAEDVCAGRYRQAFRGDLISAP